jgi:hypothetical protein
MGTLKVDTVVGSDGTSPVTLTKQIAFKAYSEQDNTGVTVNNSLNQSTITDSGNGDKIHNWINAFTDAAFVCLQGVCGNRGSTTDVVRGTQADGAWTSTSVDVNYVSATASNTDDTQASIAAVGDLA